MQNDNVSALPACYNCDSNQSQGSILTLHSHIHTHSALIQTHTDTHIQPSYTNAHTQTHLSCTNTQTHHEWEVSLVDKYLIVAKLLCFEAFELFLANQILLLIANTAAKNGDRKPDVKDVAKRNSESALHGSSVEVSVEDPRCPR